MAKTNGWVKIHRKILATRLPASQFKFFVGAILLAKTLKSPNPGLVDLSVRQLADELRMSRSEVWRREKELEEMKMVTLLEKGFIINNYKYYQTGKGVPPTGQEKETAVPPTGRSVPPTGRSVPPTGRSVPSRTSESDNKKDKNNKKSNKKPIKKAYGEFNNVLLSDNEYQKLVDKWGEVECHRMIEVLSGGMKAKPQRYKYDSHYAAILNWKRREDKEKEADHGAHRGHTKQTSTHDLKESIGRPLD